MVFFIKYGKQIEGPRSSNVVFISNLSSQIWGCNLNNSFCLKWVVFWKIVNCTCVYMMKSWVASAERWLIRFWKASSCSCRFWIGGEKISKCILGQVWAKTENNEGFGFIRQCLGSTCPKSIKNNGIGSMKTKKTNWGKTCILVWMRKIGTRW